jgi:hypothetical protein
MIMRRHILEALREERDTWEALVGGLSDAQRAAPFGAEDWSVKDHVAHLWAWQQRTAARMEAAQQDREPVFPAWPPQHDPETPGAPDRLNAWIYESNRGRPWPEVFGAWRDQYARILELGEAIPEPHLLDSTRYPWLDGHSLAMVLLATYDHHQEHLDLLRAWLGARAEPA